MLGPGGVTLALDLDAGVLRGTLDGVGKAHGGNENLPRLVVIVRLVHPGAALVVVVGLLLQLVGVVVAGRGVGADGLEVDDGFFHGVFLRCCSG